MINQIRINDPIKKYLFIIFLLFMILAVEGCENNLLSVPDLSNKDKEASFSEEENIICLDKLDENNSKEEWERFFAQRGAKKIWQTLQQNRKENLSFDFIRLAN